MGNYNRFIKPSTRKFPLIMFGGICLGIISFIVLSFHNQLKTEVVHNHRVIKLQQQSIVKGSESAVSTEIRYLIVTDKETFICESSVMNGKYNNSDIFWKLKEDSTYSFKVAGYGKSFFYDYRNILEVIK